MSTVERPGPLRYAGPPTASRGGDTTNLADLLERILDKGIVIAGDISISLVDVELLTIKLRLLIASVDKAQEMGIDWWRSDPWLSSRAAQQQQVGAGSGGQGGSGAGAALEERLDRLEAALARLAPAPRDDDGGEDS
ncbi:MAG TPA: gas vesicle protein [Acidimicrobiales bacterium]|nr:gas vesicle protein [Acidimicrobiales bacterium]